MDPKNHRQEIFNGQSEQSPSRRRKARAESPSVVHRTTTGTTDSDRGQQVAAALELIRRESCGGLRARDVFALFPCSRRLAEQRFLQITGMTVLKAIHRTRLERARQLLADPQIPIKTVANRCGWNSDVIFRRIYKAAYGVPPRADTPFKDERRGNKSRAFRQSSHLTSTHSPLPTPME